MTPHLYADEVRVAAALARRAGAVAMRDYAHDLVVEYKDNDPTNPVTPADREANALIVAGLRDAFADDAVLAEESADSHERRGHRRLWCVDPIDGTREYVAKNGQFIVMIGLAIDGRASVGVLYHPPTDRLLWGVEGQACVEQQGRSQPLRASQQGQLAAATLMVSRAHRSRAVERAAATLGVHRCVPMGSVGLKLAELALGHADIYLSMSSRMHEWDTCGPEAVLRGAGGQVSDACGAPLVYNKALAETPHGILATNGPLHPACLEALAPLVRERGWHEEAAP